MLKLKSESEVLKLHFESNNAASDQSAALSSIVSVLAGAESVTVTDHPLAPGLYGSIQANIDRNIPKHLAHRISVQPYQWGVLGQGGSVDEEELETAYLDQMAGFAAANRARFSRIICADCLWMPSQHENLIQTLLWFLAPSSASFFQKAVSAGLKIEKIWERDMNSTEGETTREWKPVREDEGPENRARWCIVGLLSR
ncbi:TPA_exp: putative Nicotinamide N-methyltransferase [Trichophyton benhamiae CBS 112371]|nr:TPA_exp: putative Nicotinamide N-methyltransferase [Trichophyton benhamiae CBS 112371]